jgi:hypothetical protein
MGAAKKLKELFFGPSREIKKANAMSSATVENLKEIDHKSNPRRDKQEVEILKHKISRRFKDDPDAAKKAALIIGKMMNLPPDKKNK